MTKFHYLISLLKNQLWIWPTAMSLLAVGWVMGAYGMQYLFTGDWPIDIEKSTLTNLFAIMASSMLTVATFAVSALVAAFSNVYSSSTPRARVLVMSDGTAQTALASFIGAFIYAVVALVALSALSYGEIGRFVLFVGFAISVGFVLMAFLRWVGLVSNLGGLDDTIVRAETSAMRVFSSPGIMGGLGGHEYPIEQDTPEGKPIFSQEIGYLCHIDMPHLEEIAARLNIEIWMCVRPGRFVDTVSEIARITGKPNNLSEKDLHAIQNAFTIAHARDFDTDPRFALIVLAEIADHSLSTASNDTGTSIRVIGTHIRLFDQWVKTRRSIEEQEIEYPHLHVPALSVEDMINDAFMPVVRSGSQYVEVSLRLQKAFHTLANLKHPELLKAAKEQAHLALEQSLEKISVTKHREILQERALR